MYNIKLETFSVCCLVCFQLYHNTYFPVNVSKGDLGLLSPTLSLPTINCDGLFSLVIYCFTFLRGKCHCFFSFHLSGISTSASSEQDIS